MGIYYKNYACGCVAAQGSWDIRNNPIWLEKTCGTDACDFKNEKNVTTNKVDEDLIKRLGITADRLKEIRNLS